MIRINHANYPIIRQVLVILLAGMVVLVGCRRGQGPSPTPGATLTPALSASPTAVPATREPSPTEAAIQPTGTPEQPVEVTPTVYPPPAQATPLTPVATVYPGPATPFPSPTSPYPGPATPFPSPTSPYPASTSAGLPAVTPTPSPYPGPGVATATQEPQSRPGYPAPTALAPTPSPLGQVTPITPAPGTAPAPSPTATQGLIRTRLQASDPRTFQIVSGQPQFVMFFAFWSPASRSMAPVIHGLEDRYGSGVRFVYLDIEDPANGMFNSLIGERSLPLFFLLDEQGNVLNEWQGYVPLEDLNNAIAPLG